MQTKKLISFVIPCYRSEHTIRGVVGEVISEVEKHPDYDYEFILSNDCSPDDVWGEIKKLRAENPKIKGICMARNMGQHSALMAGYAAAKGDYIFSLDDDGQAPVESTFTLIEKLEEGYDVVYAYYGEIKQNAFRRFGSWVARKMGQILIGMPKSFKGSSFFVMRKFVKDEVIRYKNSYPYVGGLVFRATKSITSVLTKHRARLEGKSGYSFKTLLKLWLNGFTAFSVKPLRMGTFMGAFCAFIGFVSAIVIVIRKILGRIDAAGWASMMCLTLIVGGIIMMLLGLIGEYIGRIYICINNAPQYVIKETVGLEE